MQIARPQVKPKIFIHRRRPWEFLLISIISLAALGVLLYYVSPTQQITIYMYQFSIVPGFFAVFFLFLFSLSTFLFKSKIHGILIALVAIVYLIFRMNGLTHPFFALLLLALFLVLELMFTYKK